MDLHSIRIHHLKQWNHLLGQQAVITRLNESERTGRNTTPTAITTLLINALTSWDRLSRTDSFARSAAGSRAA